MNETLRLDKYLKVSHLIKRRSVAKEASLKERVYVNGKPAKPGKDIKIGDLITITFGKKEVTVKVTSLNPATKKAEASLMYELVETKGSESE